MNSNPFLGLIQNTALLLAIAFLFDMVLIQRRNGISKLLQIPLGIILGGMGITLMLTPWVLIPGIIFDTRSILLGISGLFFGLIPTLIAIMITAIFRIYQGGSAVWMGVSVIISSGLIGIFWQRIRSTPNELLKWWELFIFGLVIHLVMLACAFVLPLQTALQVLKNIMLPVLIVYPVGTVLLGLMMVNRLQREKIRDNLLESEKSLLSTTADLQKSEELYRILTENIKDVVWILDTETMYFRYVSPSVEKMRGYTADEVMQESISHSLTAAAAEDLVGRIRRRAARIRCGDEVPGHFYTEDIIQPCKDGTDVWTEVITAYYINPENNHVEIRGVSRDISDRKKIENAMRESETRLRNALEGANDGLWDVQMLTDEFYLSPRGCEILGYQPDELAEVVKVWYQLVHPDDMKETNNRLDAHLQGITDIFEVEQRLQMKSGAWKWILTRGKVVERDENGNPLRITGTHKDISERRQALNEAKKAKEELQILLSEADRSRKALLSLLEDQKLVEEKIQGLNLELEQRVLDRTVQLKVANQELEAFSYSVSHDLRAPLRALNGFSSALISDHTNQLDEQGKHYLSRIIEAATRMGQLIEDLLNLSKVTRRDFHQENVNLSKMVYSICKELQAINSDRKIEIVIEDDISVMADSHLIKIALENLFQNAFKFTGKQNQAIIRFGLKKIDNEKVYFVSDNGVGFNMEYAGKLFTPFQRLHGINEFPGTGIGLVTVHRIITRHGGRIWPEAKENQGVTFYFTIGGINE